MSRPNQMPTVADLHRAAHRNPLVAAHLEMWRQGEFGSFEQCLVTLAVELARVNEQLAGNCNPWRDKYAHPVKSQLKIDQETLAKIQASPIDLLDAAALKQAQAAIQKRCGKIISDLMCPPPVKPFTTDGKTIGAPDDADGPHIVEDSPR